MMLIHGFVLLLTSLRLTSSWLCFKNDSSSLIFASSALTIEQFDQILKSAVVDTKILCAGTIIYNIVSNQFLIRFKSDELFATMAPTKNIIKRTTFFLGVDQKNNLNTTHSTITPVVKIDFLCYDSDFCDRILLVDYVEQLRHFDFAPVIHAFRPFIEVHQSKIQTCSIGEDFKEKPCESSSCSWSTTLISGLFRNECEKNSSHNDSPLRISTTASIFREERNDEHDKTFYESNIVQVAFYASFVCYWDRCNNFDTKEKIIEIIYKNYSAFDTSILSHGYFRNHFSSTVKSETLSSTSTNSSAMYRFPDSSTAKEIDEIHIETNSLQKDSREDVETMKTEDETNRIDSFSASKFCLAFSVFISIQNLII